ncbi:hypothetical protein mvi_01340 [Methylobacterium indicum]|uniref:Uncharacterized protein n=1 Tax=Methylobacterium indicum TaxID=1775910 RepID=A0A8H8WNY2_9HYPH|nr:hypothetical protein mvi_01340 [Methylobacterium indicum]
MPQDRRDGSDASLEKGDARKGLCDALGVTVRWSSSPYRSTRCHISVAARATLSQDSLQYSLPRRATPELLACNVGRKGRRSPCGNINVH